LYRELQEGPETGHARSDASVQPNERYGGRGSIGAPAGEARSPAYRAQWWWIMWQIARAEATEPPPATAGPTTSVAARTAAVNPFTSRCFMAGVSGRLPCSDTLKRSHIGIADS
jgi:hypothetical protein